MRFENQVKKGQIIYHLQLLGKNVSLRVKGLGPVAVLYNYCN